MTPRRKTLLYILILLAMTAWGASWSSGKVIAGTAAPETLIFWRFLITFVSFIPVMFIFKLPFRLSRKSFLQAAGGALFIVGYNKFFFLGLTYGLAGAGGVLVTSLNPIFTLILAVIVFRQSVSVKGRIGIVLGLAGGMVLLEIWRISFSQLLQSGNLYLILAASSWAGLSVLSQASREQISPLVFSFYVYGITVILDFFLALPGDILAPLKFGAVFWFNLIYLALFATTFATTIYFIASTRLGSHRASSFIFLVPFSAVLVSWLALGETPKFSTVAGGIIAVAAVYLINARTRVYERIRGAPKP